jgi:hypothetical protein
MLECKAMNTPMETNLKLLVVTSSELVDATLYRQIIGSLMYLMNTRPDICFVVNTLSQYLVEPRRVHLVGAKHVMRYLKGMLDYGSVILEIMTSDCMVILIQIGMEVFRQEEHFRMLF